MDIAIQGANYRRGPMTFRVLLISMLLVPCGALAQESDAARELQAGADSSVPIATIFTETDEDGVSDWLGQELTVRAAAVGEPMRFGEGATVFVQDESGAAIPLYMQDPAPILALDQGDVVSATGSVGAYNGSEFILVETVQVVGKAPVPEAADMLVADAKRPETAPQLVRIVGVVHVDDEADGWGSIQLEDRTGDITLFLSPTWMTGSGLAAAMNAGREVEVTGILGRGDGSAGFGGTYIAPRGPEDLSFAPALPLRAMGLVAVGLVMLGLLAWRRSAVKRARHLEGLTHELERSRQAIQAREERFRSLIENAADMVTVLAPDGEILYQSPPIHRILGIPADAVVGHNIRDLIEPSNAPAMERFLTDLQPGETREIDVKARGSDGHIRALEVLATNRVQDPHVAGIVCNVRDVTEQQVLRDRLRHTDRIEVVGRLAGGIAHDFNNVLTALRGHAEMAMDDLPADTDARADLEEVIRGADRAADLTHQLLAFSRQQVLKPRVISPRVVVESMVPMLRRLIGENIVMDLDLHAEGRIRVDPGQLEQVVMNLVVNARDAMPRGGTLRVTLSDLTVEEGDRVPCEPGTWLRVSVEDTGSGIQPEVIPHIFEPFYTTKSQGEGTGLGLATVYGIVQQSGGEVYVESKQGESSRFDLYFPAVADPVEAPPDESGAVDDDRIAGASILIVEDEPAVRNLASRVLTRNGYEVVEAESPTAALTALETRGTEFSLLLLDVVMPEMGGPELAQEIRSRGIDSAILFTSGYTDDEVFRHGVVAGETPFLEKPFSPKELLHAVAHAMSHPGTVLPGHTATAG